MPGAPKPGDKLACDTCSLAPGCSHFQAGGICTLPGSQMRGIATKFGTRDVTQILDALGELITVQAERLEEALRLESDHGGRVTKDGNVEKLDSTVSKAMDSLFQMGVQFAKLSDPKRFSMTPKTDLHLHAPANGSSPRELAAAIVAELGVGPIPVEQLARAGADIIDVVPVLEAGHADG